MQINNYDDSGEEENKNHFNKNNIQAQIPAKRDISLTTVKPMAFKLQEKSAQTLRINSDISHFQFLQKQGNTLECMLFQMNGDNVELQIQEDSTIIYGKFKNHQIKAINENISSKVIISSLKTGDSTSAVCLADGRIFAGILDFQLNEQSFNVLNQPANEKFKSYFMMAFFSYESINEVEDPSQFYLLGVEHSGNAIVQYKSNNENMKNSIKTIIPVQNTRFAAYDELNQILLLLDENLKLTFFRFQNNKLELQQFQISQADLSSYGLNDFSKILGFDFQFQADTFNIYIGSVESIFFFSYSLHPTSKTAMRKTAEKVLIFNHQIDNNSSAFSSIFADKRIESFQAQKVTVIYEKSIIIVSLRNLIQNPIVNLKSSSKNINLIRKYFCIYGKGSKTYHFYTSSEAHSIQEDANVFPFMHAYESIP